MFNLIPFGSRENKLQRLPYNLFDIDSVFENFFNDSIFPAYYSRNGQIKVDIKENEKEFIVQAELPGIKKEEINVSISDKVLAISVNKREEINEENERFIRKERRYGSLMRSFAIDNVAEEKIEAKFEDGILSLTLPKKEPENTTARKIDIQ